MTTRKLYFGHPVNTYGTALEAHLIEVIERSFPAWHVVNPNTPEHQRGYAAFKASTGSGMRYYFDRVLPSCEGGIFLPFEDGKWGAGVYGEARFLRDRGAPLWSIDARSRCIDLTRVPPPSLALSIEETRARVYDGQGGMRPFFG